MKPLGHVAVSAIISAFVWAHFRSAGCAAASFIAGVCIDLDHLIDYCLNYGLTASAKKVYCVCADMRLDKLYLFLHSYEIVILLWVFIFTFSFSNMWKSAAIGLTQHLILDQITNPVRTFSYFLTYRVLQGFKKKLILLTH